MAYNIGKGSRGRGDARGRRAERVDALRRCWNMTEADLGDVIGLSRSTVSRRISRREGFSDEELRRLAGYGNIDEGWFDREDA